MLHENQLKRIKEQYLLWNVMPVNLDHLSETEKIICVSLAIQHMDFEDPVSMNNASKFRATCQDILTARQQGTGLGDLSATDISNIEYLREELDFPFPYDKQQVRKIKLEKIGL